MKPGIHPKNNRITVKCTCGNSFNIQSTRSKMTTEVCYNCHPIYTGKSNVIDATGQVDKFQKRNLKTQTLKTKAKAKKKSRKILKASQTKKQDKVKTAKPKKTKDN